MYASRAFLISLLLTLGCKAQGDCPGGSSYSSYDGPGGQVGRIFEVICDTDINTGHDLNILTGIQLCAQNCESWNELGNSPNCTAAVWVSGSQYCYLKSGAIDEIELRGITALVPVLLVAEPEPKPS